MASGSRQTLAANLIQQGCSAALLLSLPNLLEKHEYANVVFVGVLLSFLVAADLGLALVYGRLVPALAAREDVDAIGRWDASVLLFGLLASAISALLMALIYWMKYGHPWQAAMLLPLPAALYLISFNVSRAIAVGDFSEYRRATGSRSIASLLAIPMATAGGLSGWFASQILGTLLAIGYLRRRILVPVHRIDWTLVRRHIPEGLVLCAITLAWLQLLNFGRLYASLAYPPETVAQYGIISAAYQSASTMVISIFLPVSTGVLGRFGKSDGEAFEYMRHALSRSVWWVLGGTFLATEAAPYIFRFAFPGYRFDGHMLLALLIGVVFYPFFLLLGNCMVGKQQARTYLLLITIALAASWLAARLVDLSFAGQGAAWGQLIGLATFTLSLFFVARLKFSEVARETWRHLGRLLTVVASLILLYTLLRLHAI